MKAPIVSLVTGLAVSLVSFSVVAQSGGYAPDICNGTASASTAYPWNRAASSVRVQYSYDASEVPGNGTILISRIKFRPNDAATTTTTWVGGTYGSVTILMSNGTNPSASLGTIFATNHGPNVATVFNGAVQLAAGAGNGAGVPSNPYVDIPLSMPFAYDPTKGPLLVDIAIDGSQWVPNPGTPVTTACACTFTTENKPVSRMYSTTSHTATTGSFQNFVGMVMELAYTGGTGVKTIGASCSDGFGKFGRHFSNQNPTVGNASFNLEGDTLPPSAMAFLALGFDKNFQSIDLTASGAPTCFLHTDVSLIVVLQTTAGTPSLSNGTLNMRAPVPNNPSFMGFCMRSQIAVADANSRRSFGIVFTNALGITVQ
jgi:hypothetical protein